MKRVVSVLMSVLVCAGCAGVSPAQVGQTAGTIAGAVIAPGVGAPLGAIVGLLAGMVVQGQVDKVTEKHERKSLSDELATGTHRPDVEASAAPPQGQLQRVWVDEIVKDGRLVGGHFDVRYLQ